MKKFNLLSVFIFLLSLTISQAAVNRDSNEIIDTYAKKGKNTFKIHQDNSSKKITLSSEGDSYSVEIFNSEGDILKSLELKKNSSIDVSTKDLKPGTYYVRYVGNSTKNNSVKKLVIL